jgi:hypothetical protein
MLRAEPGLTAVDLPGVTIFSATTALAPRVRFEVALDADAHMVWEKRWLLDQVDSIDAEPPVIIGATIYLAEGVVSSCTDVVSP